MASRESNGPLKEMIRRMATLLGGSVTGQLLAILSAFILTRLYGPEAFAHLEMFALVTGIAAVLGTGITFGCLDGSKNQLHVTRNSSWVG